MGRTGVLQEVRLMRFESLLARHERGELSQVEAAGLSAWASGRSGAGATGSSRRGERG
jgi:hypothetical protein